MSYHSVPILIYRYRTVHTVPYSNVVRAPKKLKEYDMRKYVKYKVNSKIL